MRIVWDKELFHSWGNKPKQKAREKQYNAEYYKRNKWRWLDNVKDKVGKTISKEKQTQKKFQDIAEANLRKAAAKAAAASSVRPIKKSSSAPIDTGGETETKKKSKGRKGSGGGKGKKGGSGGKGKKSGAGGKEKKSKDRSSSSGSKPFEQESVTNIRVAYGNKGKYVGTETIRKQRMVKVSKPRKPKKRRGVVGAVNPLPVKIKDVNKRRIKRGRKKLKNFINKNRRS